MKTFLLSTCLLALPSLLTAHEFTAGNLVINHPVAFETPVTAKSGAGYLSVTNNGDTADKLIGVRADFPRVMLHLSSEVDGVAKMIHIDSLEIPAGESVTLSPGGYHIMFMGLDGDPLEEGETFPATLVFERAGEVDIEFNVEKRSAQ